MPDPAAGEIIQATFSSQLDGQLCENVLHFREIVEASTDAAISASLEAFRLVLAAKMSVFSIFSQTRWKRVTPVPLDFQFAAITDAGTGLVNQRPMPTTCAVVVTLRTGVSGKTHRGRFYLPGWPRSWVDDNNNRFNVDGQAAANSLAAAIGAGWFTGGSDATLRLGMYSRTIGGSSPMTLAGWQQVTQAVPQSILGNQRRRRIGVGS